MHVCIQIFCTLNKLENFVCPTHVEILISTPVKGHREVFYSSRSDNPKQKYEDWRVLTITALSPAKSKSKSGKSAACKNEMAIPGATCHITLPFDYSSLFRVDNVEDDLHSILSVLGGDKMTSDVLDAYLMLCIDEYYNKVNAVNCNLADRAKYKLRSGKSKKFNRDINYQYLSVRFMPVKKRDQCLNSLQPDMDYFPSFVHDEEDCVLLAPQYVDKHFYLAVINFKKRSVQVHDSSWHFLPMELRTAQLQTILKAVAEDWDEWKIHFVKKSAPQLDEYSCGVFTIFYAENLVKGLPAAKNCRKLSKVRIEKIREEICRRLLSTTVNGRKFLEAISD